MRTFAWMYGLIQGFGFLLGLVLVTQSETEDMIMLLNKEIWIEILGSSGSCCIRDSTSLVKENQSTPLQHHLTFLGMTVWYLVLWLMTMVIGRSSELLIGSVSVHDALVVQLQPQSDKSGVLSFPMV